MMELGCTCAERRWNSGTKKCEACGCRNVACCVSASRYGITCTRAIGHNGDHVSRDGYVIHAPRDYRGH